MTPAGSLHDWVTAWVRSQPDFVKQVVEQGGSEDQIVEATVLLIRREGAEIIFVEDDLGVVYGVMRVENPETKEFEQRGGPFSLMPQ